MCTCAVLCVCVCCTEGCLTPNRCHYFPLSSSLLSMSAEVFLLFCLCYFVCVCACGCVCACTHGWECGTEREGRHVLVCAHVWVGASQNGSQKVPDTFLCFLVSRKVWKISFPTKTCATKKLWCIKCHSVEGISLSHWYKYNLSSRSRATF